jgi:DNA processing protein
VADAADEQLAWIALSEVRAPAAWWRRPVGMLGSARALFDAPEAELQRIGLDGASVAALRRRTCWKSLDELRRRCEHEDIAIVSYAAEHYPASLREISDPPAILYYRGSAPGALALPVAIVGSRRPTRYGRRVARRIGAELAAAGATVVSGLAYGIDACAHEGALEAGRSAAVLACGLDRPYPRANRGLFDRLVTSAGVMSEHPPETDPLPFRFPARNRIITGISRAVVIVEAAERSGSLVSAKLALDQGRELFAVPGNIDSATSRGTNGLLREGCAPLLDAADVLGSLGLMARARETPGETAGVRLEDPDARVVLAALEDEPTRVDELADTCGLDGARILELLTTLELAGLAERSPGGLYLRSQRAGFAREP